MIQKNIFFRFDTQNSLFHQKVAELFFKRELILRQDSFFLVNAFSLKLTRKTHAS